MFPESSLPSERNSLLGRTLSGCPKWRCFWDAVSTPFCRREFLLLASCNQQDLKKRHKAAGVDLPTHEGLVRNTLKGIRRTLGPRPCKKPRH